jgi:hypothetical protein
MPALRKLVLSHALGDPVYLEADCITLKEWNGGLP